MYYCQWRVRTLLLYFSAILLLGHLVQVSTASECSATKHCESGCCSRYGFCGFSDDHCGEGCLSTCDAKPENPSGSGGECSASVPCENGCCSKYGNCGYGEDYCSKHKGCVNNCDSKSECDPGWGAKWSKSETCPLNVCCSKYGFCGTTEQFCGEDDQVKRPSCSVEDHSIDRVIGYYEEWSLNRPCNTMRPEQIPAGYYTHLNFAFASIDPETFEVVPSSVGDKSLWQRMQGIRIEQPGIEIWIALGGWKFNNADQPTNMVFSNIARSEENQKKFSDSLLSMMATYGFDGVDIDWEYPVAEDRSGREEDFENFPKWMENLRSSLKGSGKGYGLSLTLPASYWYLQHFDIIKLEDSVDWFNFMSYDLHGIWDKENEWVGPYINSHTNLTEIKDALDLLWRNDIDPAKVSLGMAFYGRSFTLVSADCPDPGCVYSSGGNAGPCSETIGFLLNSEISHIIDKQNLSPSLYDDAAVKAINWGDQWVSFDDGDTFKLKGDFAKSQCLGGAMVWAISQDDQNASFAKQLTSGLGREPISLPDYTTPVPSTQAPEHVDTCRWTNCGENCPSGWKWIDREGTDLKMTDETGCFGHQYPHKFCCPGNSELPTCRWRGMPSIGNICSEGCEDGEVEVGTLSLQYCGIEHQSACCTSVKSTEAYGQCTWVGSAPICSESGGHEDCPDDYPDFVFASSNGAGGEQVCTQGAKSYCCKGIPLEFKDCAWHQKATHVFPQDYLCESSCPTDQIRLGMQSGSCFFGLEAYCCKGTEIVTVPPDLQPRDPGRKYFKEYSKLIDTFVEHPTAPDGYKSYSWFKPKAGQWSKRSPKLDLYDFNMMNTYFIRSIDSHMESLKDQWNDYGPPIEFGNHLTTTGFVEFIDPSRGDINTYAVARDMNANVQAADQAMTQLEQSRSDLCVLDEEEEESVSAKEVKRTLPDIELDGMPVLDERHIDVLSEGTSAQPPGSQPRMVTILQGILDGQLTLHYTRWQAFTDQDNNGQNAGPMLELAYWIGTDIGTLGPNANQYQEHADDQWVVFHVHFRNDNRLTRTGRRQGQHHWFFGVTRIQVYHGQRLMNLNNAHGDPRVDNRDRSSDNQVGRNTRSRAFVCPEDRRWYVGQAETPSATGHHHYAHYLAQWGARLFDHGYLTVPAFQMIYPPDSNGRFNFHPANYRNQGDGMRRNFRTVLEDPDFGDWGTQHVDITQNLPSGS